MNIQREYFNSGKMQSSFITILLTICFFVYSSNAQTNPNKKLEEAKGFYSSQYFDKAIELLEELSQDISVDSEIRKESFRILGRAYVAKGLYQEAKDAFKQLIIIKPDFAYGHYFIGASYFASEEYRKAEASFKQAIKIKPDLGDAHFTLGLVYIKLNNKIILP